MFALSDPICITMACWYVSDVSKISPFCFSNLFHLCDKIAFNLVTKSNKHLIVVLFTSLLSLWSLIHLRFLSIMNFLVTFIVCPH